MTDSFPDRYYRDVARYYDRDAVDFEQRYRENYILQRLRTDFRAITERYPFQSMLEIGCGPGLDLIYFGRKYPSRTFTGIDISPGMIRLARANTERERLANIHLEMGSVENLDRLFGDRSFDMIICYFGALNTVYDLAGIVPTLHRHLSYFGRMVLTFVNRWYLFDVIWYLLHFDRQRAFARITNNWKGYSPTRELESTCRSAREIARIFRPWFTITGKKGYSILYPAWYRSHRLRPGSTLDRWLWKADQFLNRTPLWNLGEYSLYVMEPKNLKTL
jgi:ubiquinone/menaquinone biosynthesis C-methylase UbiE